MILAGSPSDWVGIIESMVPSIMDLVVTTWETMPPLDTDSKEDPTTDLFCRLLRQNRNSGDLPFQIHIQMVELDPAADQSQGRMDIAFLPAGINRENIYFCLECKRLNVTDDKGTRAYSTEYVTHGLSRFVGGQYASSVKHGGMIGYVLDGDVNRAMKNVEGAVKTHHVALGMAAPVK